MTLEKIKFHENSKKLAPKTSHDSILKVLKASQQGKQKRTIEDKNPYLKVAGASNSHQKPASKYRDLTTLDLKVAPKATVLHKKSPVKLI
jgi:hypothetical protein